MLYQIAGILLFLALLGLWGVMVNTKYQEDPDDSWDLIGNGWLLWKKLKDKK